MSEGTRLNGSVGGVGGGSRPLAVLAMDHRASLVSQVYGIPGDVDAAAEGRIGDDKLRVFEAAVSGMPDLPPGVRPGVLVDERYGAEVARRARHHGFALLMPIERSGRPFFELEYGDFASSEWLDHVAAFDPDFVKVLIRDNPGFAATDRLTQLERLAQVSQALDAAGRRLVIELLVPQASESGAPDQQTFDDTLRPAMTVQLIREYHRAGIEPAIWKLEGYDSADAAAEVADAARENGRDRVECIVLGRDAGRDQLDRWLSVAAPTPGFDGFAIGRSIWQQPLIDRLAGKTDEARFRSTIAGSFAHFATIYQAARDRAR
ncbi:2-deoxy-5-keto-D-gluconate 6-phosphate aldolase domain-containing protein [Leifsonia poae]|uniref:2-deoxy-5-keto-D-gluconate 6-phosphate aldolase domain-containing protein n=1 Tax=Leifsonia poae TaxID=110933 RepID=UPI001CC0C0AB|nr:DUF2090 domain-containing protein [Leifsonia poae]